MKNIQYKFIEWLHTLPDTGPSNIDFLRALTVKHIGEIKELALLCVTDSRYLNNAKAVSHIKGQAEKLNTHEERAAFAVGCMMKGFTRSPLQWKERVLVTTIPPANHYLKEWWNSKCEEGDRIE